MSVASDLKHADLNAVLKTALDAVVVMRVDGTVAAWNDVAARIFGWSFEDAAGQRMSELIIPPQHREAHERGLVHFLATGEGPVIDRHIEITALHRDGREFPVELSITFTREFSEPIFLGFLRDISERRDAERRQQLLLAELSHRVKNMLAVVGGIAQQTARSSSSLEGFVPAFTGRLQALAKAHEMLTISKWESSGLGDVAHALLGPYTTGPDPRVTIGGPAVMLTSRQVLSLSMILHELITNAAKYGALANAGGRIALAWQRCSAADGQRIALTWKEAGLAGVDRPASTGFGLKMIRMNAGHELDGTVELDWADDGLALTLEFPVSATQSAP